MRSCIGFLPFTARSLHTRSVSMGWAAHVHLSCWAKGLAEGHHPMRAAQLGWWDRTGDDEIVVSTQNMFCVQAQVLTPKFYVLIAPQWVLLAVPTKCKSEMMLSQWHCAFCLSSWTLNVAGGLP